MEMRTRVLGRLNNFEVEEYLQRNDIIFIPVGSGHQLYREVS